MTREVKKSRTLSVPYRKIYEPKTSPMKTPNHTNNEDDEIDESASDNQKN